MEILEWLRLIAGGALLLSGLIIFLIELYGVFHLKYVLNRMHAAAMGDTLGISFSSHLLARLEVVTNEKLENHCQSYSDLAVLEEELKKEREKETGGEEV